MQGRFMNRPCALFSAECRLCATALPLSRGAKGSVTGYLGTGAAIGAAGGPMAGAIQGASEASRPAPTYKNFVDRCLCEKGYEPIGWE